MATTTTTTTTHYMQNGFCVICESDAEWLTEYSLNHHTLIELEPGSLVYWGIKLTGERGAVDETFAPSKSEAERIAKERHGLTAHVFLLKDRLELAQVED